MPQPDILPGPSSFVGNGPDYASYFSQGQQMVQSVIDAQYQAQQRAALLDQEQRKAALDEQLGPIQVQQASANVASTQAGTAADLQRTNQSGQLFPSQLSIAQTNAQYDPAIKANDLLNQRIGVTLAQRGLGPGILQNPDGSTSVTRPAMPLGGYGVNSTDLPTDGSPANPSALTGTVRTTTYGINDPQSDPETAAGKTSTGAPVVPASPGMAGTAAVDPTKIPYGSIIKLKDGSTYVAGDTGGAVKSQQASGGKAPVIDLVGRPGSVADWNDVTITPPTADYVHLSPTQKLAYHQAAATSSATPSALPPDTVLTGNDGGILNRAIAQANALPGSITAPTTSIPGASLVNPTPIGAPSFSGVLQSSINPPPVASVAPITTPAIAPVGTSLPIPLYKPVPSPFDKNTLISQPNPEADKVLETARLGQVDPRPFIHQGANGNGFVDLAGLEAAEAQKAQGLAKARFQQEMQSNKDIQAFHTAANQANSIRDNLNAFPFATRNASNDNAVEKSAGGNELPGQAVSEASLKSIGSGQTYGEGFTNFLSKTPMLNVWNAERQYLPSALAPTSPNLPTQPRNLSDRVLKSTADTVQSNVASRYPAYQAAMDQLRSQAKSEGFNPDDIFPPQDQAPYENAVTREMYPGQKSVVASTTHPDNDAAGTIRAQGGKQYQKQADGTWQPL